ncbi:MAG: TRAP transporter small permease subunit [Clostridia bacterium]|jgi:TRAP-type mannitol/chloroaromatic compound transport system permease small subunit|nr:TRAP transporter small permease subunit [Clostridia bacterium]
MHITVKTIVTVIDTVNEKIARILSYLAILLILQLCYEVVCRYIIGRPNIWSFDATYFISSILVLYGFAYTWKKGGHVSVDLFAGFMPKRVGSAIFCVFMLALFFPTWGNIVNQMFINVQYSWKILERSTAGSMPPIYPYKTWMMVGVILFMIQGVSEFLKSVYFVFTGRQLLDEQKEGVNW